MLCLLVASSAACGDTPRIGARESHSPPSEPARPDSASATARTILFTAREYTFEAPAIIPAGRLSLRLVNRGAEAHEARLLKLEGDGALEELFDALEADTAIPASTRVLGTLPSADPGRDVGVVLVLEPGDYLIVCLLTDAGGTRHVARGMIRPLAVIPES